MIYERRLVQFFPTYNDTYILILLKTKQNKKLRPPTAKNQQGLQNLIALLITYHKTKPKKKKKSYSIKMKNKDVNKKIKKT